MAADDETEAFFSTVVVEAAADELVISVVELNDSSVVVSFFILRSDFHDDEEEETVDEATLDSERQSRFVEAIPSHGTSSGYDIYKCKSHFTQSTINIKPSSIVRF
jgi:hypothetical protein